MTLQDVRGAGHRAPEADDAVTRPIAIPAPRSTPTPAPAAPPAPASHARPVPPARRRRRWPWIVGALVLLVVLSKALSGGTATTTSSAPATPGAPAAGLTAPSASAAPAPAVAPKTYTGRGDDVVTIDKPAGLAIMTFSCPKCSGNTIVQTDGSESLLVNTIGSYTGKHWLDATTGSTTSRLTIKATGAWKVVVGGLDQARQASGPVSGRGDDVVVLNGGTTTAALTNRGQENFIVQTVSADGSSFAPDLAVNEIGSYSGTVPMSAPTVVQVQSDGAWTITPKP